jgi:hypothetical protein
MFATLKELITVSAAAVGLSALPAHALQGVESKPQGGIQAASKPRMMLAGVGAPEASAVAATAGSALIASRLRRNTKKVVSENARPESPERTTSAFDYYVGGEI